MDTNYTIIKLNGKYPSEVKVDTDQLDFLNQWKWYGANRKGVIYPCRQYEDKTGKYIVYMHRVIMNAPDGIEVDHINGDTLDNRKCNLRLDPDRKINKNRKIQKNKKSSKFKGVYTSGENTFRARIWSRTHQKNLNLGTFDTEEEAYAAYMKAAEQEHGEWSSSR
jgi:hypothetical protein